jgi:hypothetical protein
MTYPLTLSKSDQRFALAVVCVAMQAFFGFLAIVYPPSAETGLKVMLSFSGLTGAAVAWYFSSRRNET